jgi:peptide/nickel transport system substrate-binding protein
MASPTAFKKWGPADYQGHQVGTGPFIFSEKDYVPRQQIVIVKNPDYNWASTIYKHTGPAYLDKVTFRFYPDAATRAAALESGGVDVIGELPPVDAERLKKDAKYQVMVTRTDGLPVVVFVNTKNAPLNDLKVRQALLYATDRKAIVKTIFRDLSPVAYGPWAGLGFNKDLETLYPYDLKKAQQLLDEAGWKAGPDGIRVKDGNKLVLDTLLQTWGYLSEIGQMLQAQLKMAGVDLKTQTVSFPAAQQAGTEGKFHLAPMSLSATDPSFLAAVYSSKGNYNWTKLNDPALDKLLDDAAATTDNAKRLDLYKQVQRIAMEQATIIPVREQWNNNAATAKVKGLVFSVQGWWPYLYDVKIER